MVCLWWGCEMSVPLRQVNRMEVLLQHWHRMFVFWFQIFFFFIPCIFISLFELWCSPKSAVQHWYQNNQIQAPSGFHLVWISSLSVLYRWILQCRHIHFFFFVIFDSWGFSKIGLARARETHNPFILCRWLWTTFGNVNNSLFLFFFFLSLLAARLE